MSEEAAPEAAEGAPKGKDKAPKAKAPLPIIALLVINLGATGFGVFKILNLPAASAATKAEVVIEKATKEVTGPVVPLDAFVVNLDEPGTARYLKLTIQLELVDAKAEEIIDKSKQVIRDEVLRHLSGLKLADTLGAKAKDTLRDDMMKMIEDIVGKGKVRRMFFQEFVVQ
ncbi:MAG TPA: flagellar basal body-associated FliL family protein [Kofleriaceae bacterium]|jgi:flagellar FliL protein|nr:flagellar basal body-associated FliL family protein [Kofleriaceae bacterium]